MPVPNHEGRRTDGGSHGNDTDSDGTYVIWPQPIVTEKGNSLFRQAGHPVAGCHGFQAVAEVTRLCSVFVQCL